MRPSPDRLLRKGDYVYGSFLKPERVDGWINAVNPGDRGDALGRFAFSAASVDDAVGHAARGAARWRSVPLEERMLATRAFRKALHEHADTAAMLLVRENGKPLWEARQEVSATLRAVDVYLDEAPHALAGRALADGSARSEPLPRGVVAVVSPYAMPLLNAVGLTTAALLAGNAVVHKPSKFSPGIGQLVAETWDRCRLPRGAFNMVQGSGSVVGTALVSHPDIDALVFAGNYESALEVRKSTAARPELPAVYQCGGKGTALVLPSADLERAAYEVLVGAFLGAGQRGTSTGRVLVHARVHDAFVRILQARAARLRVGYGMDDDVFMGPVISENFRVRNRKYARAVESKGHRVILDTGLVDVPGRRGNYVGPTLLDVDPDAQVAFFNDEPPGPTLLCYRVHDADHAIAIHEQLRFRAVTSVFAAPDDPALPRLLNELHTGAIHVNRATVSTSTRLPSLALGRASNGVPAGVELLRTLTASRVVLGDGGAADDSAMLPGVRWDDVTETSGKA